MVPKVFEPLKFDCIRQTVIYIFHSCAGLLCTVAIYRNVTRDVKFCAFINQLKNPCLRHQSIIIANLKAEGEPEKGVACLQHIFPQFVFNTYSLPSKGGKEGAYYTILKKSKLQLVSFRMISAKETSSGTK